MAERGIFDLIGSDSLDPFLYQTITFLLKIHIRKVKLE